MNSVKIVCLTFSLSTTRHYSASKIWSNISMDTLRPLPVFLGVTGNNFCMSADAFTPPVKKVDKASPEKVTSRIRLNVSYFLTNYALVAFGVAVVVALMHPGMLVSLGIVWSLWWGHNYLISNELILFDKNIGSLVSISHRFYALFVITTVTVVWKCLRPAITFSVITSVIIMFHAIMRDPKHIDKYGSSSAGVKIGSADSDEEEDDVDDDNNGSAVMVDRPDKSEV